MGDFDGFEDNRGLVTWRALGLVVAATLVVAALWPCDEASAQRVAQAPGPVSTPAQLRRDHWVGAVNPAELHATVAALVGFGTRHTLSDTQSPTRGIGAARHWAVERFLAISRDCGGCLELVTPSETVTGPRMVPSTPVMDVVAIQRGTTDPSRVIAITGHIDSRVSSDMDATHDAPGADDDASGVAVVVEAARVLSREKFPATIVYGVLSGEEQGLYGGKILAAYARAQHWDVEADLNNDIVGNIHGGDGVVDNSQVRVFSEGTRSTETEKEAEARRYNGGEVDSPSRNLARFMESIAESSLTNFRVRMIYRTDRYGRGGDQVAFLAQGYPAVRVTEGHENYTRQHQDVRKENGVAYGDVIEGVDFDYLAQVARLNIASAGSLAAAPAPPSGLVIRGAVSDDTSLSWQASPGAAGYRVWWRATTAPNWEHVRPVMAGSQATSVTLSDTIIDDWFFGVSAVAEDGFESPVEFPGVAGAFFHP